MKKSISSLMILTAAALWGCIALFYDGLSSLSFTPLQIVCIRVTVAAVLMAVYILIKDRSLFRFRLRDAWLFVGTGIVSLAFFNYCYFSAMEQLSHSVAAVLLYTAPVFVMLFSAVLFRERITLPKVIALLLTVIGCVLVTDVLSGAFVTPLGILFGLGSGIGYALYTIFGVLALRNYRTETITFYTFLFAAVGVWPLCNAPQMLGTAAIHPYETSLYGLGIGFFVCVLPYWLYTKGLSGVQAGKASVMATLEPVVATLIGVWVLHNSMSLWKAFGIVLILSAIIVLNLPKKET